MKKRKFYLTSLQTINYLNFIRLKTRWSWKTICDELNKGGQVVTASQMSLIINKHSDATEQQDVAINKLYRKIKGGK